MTGHQQIGIDLKLGALLDLCLADDHRRMNGYDSRLLRPTFVPRMTKLARSFLRS